MNTAQAVLLGAIAGATIYLGLPLGRMRSTNLRLKTFLSGVSIGVLVFLEVEIFGHAFEGVEESLQSAHSGESTWGQFAEMAAVFAFGAAAGLLTLLYLARLLKPTLPKDADSESVPIDPLDLPHVRRREALHLGMSIAAAIGLHNFSEGLAIGQSAGKGETTLALLLVIGFALHNATEGFGIVGPLAGAGARASWGWLGLAGLVGGGPTFLGTIIGISFQSEFVFTAFLALAGGAILYVLGELFASGRRTDWEMTLWGTLAGFIAGGATDLVLVLASA